MLPFQALFAMLSVAILVTTGYAWGALRNVNSSLMGSNVIENERNSSDGATDILLVGNDSRTDAQGNPLPDEMLRKLRATDEGGNLTDTMILVRIPDDDKRASAVSFPRDTMVDMGRFGENKLNSAFPRAKAEAERELADQNLNEQELAKQSRVKGQKFLINTIEDLAGVSIDHYAEVNLLGFYKLTEVVGGVKVCLKNPVDDYYSGADFPAGPQVISKGDALAFVRQRHGLPRGDLDRIVRQQVFMSGLAKRMLSAGILSNPAKLGDLIDALKSSVVLDKGWDVMDFAQQMQGIAAGNIRFHTIPVTMSESGGLEADNSEVRRFVDNLLLSPKKRQAKQRAQANNDELRTETTVNVYNAAGVSGLAGRVRQNLTEDGYDQGVAANAEEMRQSTVVRYASGEKDAAKLVAEDLGGVETSESTEVESGAVSVYLGDDYSGPGARRFVGKSAVRLDGAGGMKAQETTQQEPITADGVPCVN